MKQDERQNAITERQQFDRLRRWNGWLAIAHALQAFAIFVLSGTHTLPVTTQFLSKDALASSVAGHPVLRQATRHLFEINLAHVVVVFLLLSAIAHMAMATFWRERYEAGLRKGINRLRWVEYSLSASVMIVAIGLLSGIADLSTLLLTFGLTALMNLQGLVMEQLGRKKPVAWLPFWLGAGAGILPWIVFGVYIFGAQAYSGSIPAFVYWIYASLFVCFASFAANMFLQYKKYGRWANYLYGERMYMVLSLVAKTALAWQIFAGTLRP